MSGDIAEPRKLVQTVMAATCDQYDKWQCLPDDTRSTLVRRMERGCFEVVIEAAKRDGVDRRFANAGFASRYSAVCARLIANLDVNGSVQSTYLIDGIINGTIDVYEASRLDSCGLCPEASQKERDMIAVRRTQTAVKKVSRAHRCYKCGKNETLPVAYQARCADEDSSQSIKCVHCGNIWRKG
jgi:DNA-directed RNA polymerase subunit M/transcription elongation factor TFIIS